MLLGVLLPIAIILLATFAWDRSLWWVWPIAICLAFIVGRFAWYRKNYRLWSISRRLGRPVNDYRALIDGKRRSEEDKAFEELLRLCESDPSLSDIMKRHGANRATLTTMYHLLLMAGAGQWAGLYFVAASTLAFPRTLDYALRTLVRSPPLASNHPTVSKVAGSLIRFFEGEADAIADTGGGKHS